jgi:2-C-methyl-D-erythritol 2,4-cyclodiphosphate synthase
MKIKVGNGFDAHRFDETRPLYLGGILIENEAGLAGHSDADVLIHAIVDSIVGVTLGTDIGGLFPDTNMAFKGIDSKILLKEAIKLTTEKGFTISSIDSTIIAQKPKLAPHIPKMREVLAEICNIDIEDMTIKATTTEKMGFTGRKEGIAAMSTATILK